MAKRISLTKMFKVLIILIFLTFLISNFAVMAYDVTGKFDGDVSQISSGATAVKNILGTALDIVRYVGIGIALIILMYIGAKVIMASPSEKANIKQYAINYVIGAFILIGASGILTIIKNFIQNSVVAAS